MTDMIERDRIKSRHGKFAFALCELPWNKVTRYATYYVVLGESNDRRRSADTYVSGRYFKTFKAAYTNMIERYSSNQPNSLA